MSKMSAKGNFTAMLSAATIGAALSFGIGAALPGDNLPDERVLHPRTPAKKAPRTRGLSVGAPAEAAPKAEESRFVQSIRRRATRSLSNTEREEIASIAKDKPNIDLE